MHAPLLSYGKSQKMKSMITIGRSHRCDIVVENENVSRVHAQISVINGQYVYEDVSSNGSVIGGRVVRGQRVVIAPGSPVLMANRVPLPWPQIYAMLPLRPVSVDGDATVVGGAGAAPAGGYGQPPVGYGGYAGGYGAPEDRLNGGFWVLFIIAPLVGFILYFVWRDRYPHRAHSAAIAAWIGFGINVGFPFLCFLAAM